MQWQLQRLSHCKHHIQTPLSLFSPMRMLWIPKCAKMRRKIPCLGPRTKHQLSISSNSKQCYFELSRGLHPNNEICWTYTGAHEKAVLLRVCKIKKKNKPPNKRATTNVCVASILWKSGGLIIKRFAQNLYSMSFALAFTRTSFEGKFYVGIFPSHYIFVQSSRTYSWYEYWPIISIFFKN